MTIKDNKPEDEGLFSQTAGAQPATDKAEPEKAVKTPEATTTLTPRGRLTGAPAISSYLNNDEVKKIVQKRIGSKPEPFIAAIMTAVNGNPKLAECTPQSILGAAIEATGLNLSVNPALGEAYLVPYKDQATLQVGYKGFIQLAQRSGQYKTIATTAVREGQLVDEDPLHGNTYDWKSKKSDKVIGYVAYFKLLNGFEASWYMTVAEIQKHASHFSQAYRANVGPWKDEHTRERMFLKTPLRFLLGTYGPRSVEVDKALMVDQAVIEGDAVTYPDNKPEYVDRIEAAQSPDDLKEILASLPVEDKKEAAPLIEARAKELK